MKMLSSLVFDIFLFISLSFSNKSFATEIPSDLASLSTANNGFYHILKSCDTQNGMISLQDKTKISIDWWYQSNLKQWNSEDRLRIYYDFAYNQLRIENIESNSICWGNFKSISNYDAITSVYKLDNTTDDSNAISLKSGFHFEGPRDEGSPFAFWKKDDVIFVLHETEDHYLLWNRSQKFLMHQCTLISTDSQDEVQN